MSWSNSEKIAVVVAIDDDQKTNDMTGATWLKCPVCESESLKYNRETPLSLIAWCSYCETGLQQGGSAEQRSAMRSESKGDE